MFKRKERGGGESEGKEAAVQKLPLLYQLHYVITTRVEVPLRLGDLHLHNSLACFPAARADTPRNIPEAGSAPETWGLEDQPSTRSLGYIYPRDGSTLPRAPGTHWSSASPSFQGHHPRTGEHQTARTDHRLVCLPKVPEYSAFSS